MGNAIPDRQASGAEAARGRDPSLDAVTVILAFSLWLTTGSLVLAAADGGDQPARRVAIGALLVALAAAALWARHGVVRALRARPWLVLVAAALQAAAAIADGVLPSSPFVVIGVTSIVLAVAVARPPTVWLSVVLLDSAYAAAILAQRTPSELARDDQVAGVAGALLGYPCAALVGLAVVRLFARCVAHAGPTLDALRGGAPALTPALTSAICGPADRVPRALETAETAGLTAAERRVMLGLAEGLAPKELAHARGVSLTTVRTHIRNAKRKTGARTLAELAAMAAAGGADRQGHTADRGGRDG